MQYLGLALYAEGPTDYYFLRPLLQRLCEEICVADSPHRVEFSEVLELDHPVSLDGAPREQRILHAAIQAKGAWRILFVHADGAGNAERARNERTNPALELLRKKFEYEGRGVAVVPIRELEAWILQDGDSLRAVFGTTLNDDELGLPSGHAAIEAMRYPKATLAAAFTATGPSGRRRRQGISPLLNALGEQVRLARLRQLPGFLALEVDLRRALKELQVL